MLVSRDRRGTGCSAISSVDAAATGLLDALDVGVKMGVPVEEEEYSEGFWLDSERLGIAGPLLMMRPVSFSGTKWLRVCRSIPEQQVPLSRCCSRAEGEAKRCLHLSLAMQLISLRGWCFKEARCCFKSFVWANRRWQM